MLESNKMELGIVSHCRRLLGHEQSSSEALISESAIWSGLDEDVNRSSCGLASKALRVRFCE